MLGKLKSAHLAETLNPQELRAPLECSSRPISDDPTQLSLWIRKNKRKEKAYLLGLFAQQKLLRNCQNRKKSAKTYILAMNNYNNLSPLLAQ